MCILQISFPVTCEILPCISCNPSHSPATVTHVSFQVEADAAWALPVHLMTIGSSQLQCFGSHEYWNRRLKVLSGHGRMLAFCVLCTC
jgi:hypothetical protein